MTSLFLSAISSICKRGLGFKEGELIADGQPAQLQDMLTGRKTLQVEVMGDSAGIIAKLEQIPEVMQVKPLGQTQTGGSAYQIDYRVETDIRSAVYHVIKVTECDLLMM